MFFKNLQVYRLPAPWAMTADRLAAQLASHTFAPASSNELLREGWAPPRAADQLVHVVNGQFLIKLQSEKKLLPATVINQVTKARAAELEEAQGFAPGKKAMKELKERVTDELLPRAFSIASTTMVWIDPKNGWLVVDAASPTKADTVIKLLLKSVDCLPLESLRVQRSPVGVMTGWLDADEAPAGFTVDQDATLRATGESKAQVAYKRSLQADDVRRHIAAGKQCTRLAMTWDSKISFVLDESLAVKSVKPLDVLTEREITSRNDDERFDGDLMLMTGELAKMLADLVTALGGEARMDDSPTPRDPAKGDELVREKRVVGDDGTALAAARRLRNSLIKDGATATITFGGTTVELGGSTDVPTGDRSASDPLYEQAVAVLRANHRASISLVQRQLQINYSRAGELMKTARCAGAVEIPDNKATGHMQKGEVQ